MGCRNALDPAIAGTQRGGRCDGHHHGRQLREYFRSREGRAAVHESHSGELREGRSHGQHGEVAARRRLRRRIGRRVRWRARRWRSTGGRRRDHVQFARLGELRRKNEYGHRHRNAVASRGHRELHPRPRHPHAAGFDQDKNHLGRPHVHRAARSQLRSRQREHVLQPARDALRRRSRDAGGPGQLSREPLRRRTRRRRERDAPVLSRPPRSRSSTT